MQSMMKNMAKTMPNNHHHHHRGLNTASPTSTTSSSSGVSSAASQYLSGSLLGDKMSSSKSCDRIHAIGRGGGNRMRRDKSLDSQVKYRTENKSSNSKGTPLITRPWFVLSRNFTARTIYSIASFLLIVSYWLTKLLAKNQHGSFFICIFIIIVRW